MKTLPLFLMNAKVFHVAFLERVKLLLWAQSASTQLPVRNVEPGEGWVLKRETPCLVQPGWHSVTGGLHPRAPQALEAGVPDLSTLADQPSSGRRRADIFLFSFPKAFHGGGSILTFTLTFPSQVG